MVAWSAPGTLRGWALPSRRARAVNALSPQLKPAGTACRGPSNSCDLPEFCSGASPHCPANVYLHDGHPCQGVDGYCYNGICQTHEQQCAALWGPGTWCLPLSRVGRTVCSGVGSLVGLGTSGHWTQPRASPEELSTTQ